MALWNAFGKYLSVLLVAGAMLVGMSLAQAQDQTLEGTVSDARCGMDHSGREAKQCTLGCVGRGSNYVLVVSDKVYTLEGGPVAELEKLAGEKAKVTGRVDGMTVHVASVAAGS